MSSFSLSPTDRTTLRRGRNRAVTDRDRLLTFLGDALVAHLGVVAGGPGGAYPVVLPTAYAIDVDGPDDGGSLYLHGSVAARWLRAALGAPVCVTVTELDGLVAARSAFHHSMNYRSAVVYGTAREVTEAAERQHALDLIVDQMIPGRSTTLRPSTRRELAATLVLAVPLAEASMKARSGGPVDDPDDVEAGIWGGHLPLHRVVAEAVPDADARGPVPTDVMRRASAARRVDPA